MQEVRSRSSGKKSLVVIGGRGSTGGEVATALLGDKPIADAGALRLSADKKIAALASSSAVGRTVDLRLNFSSTPGRRLWPTPLRFTVLSQPQQIPHDTGTESGSHDSGEAGSKRATVLVVDFGAQYAQLIARRVRELNVFSEIVGHRLSAAEMAAKHPAAIILSGGPKSVHVDGAPSLDPDVYDLGIPIFGICYGAQLIAQQLGGTVGRGMKGEYGRTELTRNGASLILPDEAPSEHECWMSHFDGVTEAPAGFTVTASSPGAPVAVLENDDRKIYGVQFHPESILSEHGHQLLKNFLDAQ